MKKKRKIWWIILGIVVVAIAAIIIVKASKSANKELVIRTHVVTEYTVENTVTATGTIQPVETVEVGTQVSGKVEKIYVDFNDVVKKGQLMAELDKQTLNQSLSRAKASLTSAESNLTMPSSPTSAPSSFTKQTPPPWLPTKRRKTPTHRPR